MRRGDESAHGQARRPDAPAPSSEGRGETPPRAGRAPAAHRTTARSRPSPRSAPSRRRSRRAATRRPRPGAVRRLRSPSPGRDPEDAARGLAAAAGDVARLESRELGKPLRETRKELTRAAETLQIAAAEARRLGGRCARHGGMAGRRRLRRRSPFASPSVSCWPSPPFNAPLNLLTHKIAASFAAGNTTIVQIASAGARDQRGAGRGAPPGRDAPGGDPAPARRGRGRGRPRAGARGAGGRVHGQPGGGRARGVGGRREAPGAGAGRQRGHDRVRRRRHRRGGPGVRRDRVQATPARAACRSSASTSRRPRLEEFVRTVPPASGGAEGGRSARSRDRRRDHGRSGGGRKGAGVGGRGRRRGRHPRAGRHRHLRHVEPDPAGVPSGHREGRDRGGLRPPGVGDAVRRVRGRPARGERDAQRAAGRPVHARRRTGVRGGAGARGRRAGRQRLVQPPARPRPLRRRQGLRHRAREPALDGGGLHGPQDGDIPRPASLWA